MTQGREPRQRDVKKASSGAEDRSAADDPRVDEWNQDRTPAAQTTTSNEGRRDMTYPEHLKEKITSAAAALESGSYEYEVNGFGEMQLTGLAGPERGKTITLNLPAILDLIDSQPDEDISDYVE